MANGQVIALTNMFSLDRLHRAVEQVLYEYSMRGTFAYADQNRYLIRHYMATSLPQVIHLPRYRAGAEPKPVLCLPADFSTNGYDRRWILAAAGSTASISAVRFNQLPGFTDMYKASHLRQMEKFNQAALQLARQGAADMSKRLQRAAELSVLYSNRRYRDKALVEPKDDISFLLDDDALRAVGAGGRRQVRRALLAMFFDETLFPQSEGETTKLSPNMLANVPENEADNAISNLFRKIDSIETRIIAPETAAAMRAAGDKIEALLADYEVGLARRAVADFEQYLDASTLDVMQDLGGYQTTALYGWLNPQLETKQPHPDNEDKRVRVRVLDEGLATRRRAIVTQYPLLLENHKNALRLINRGMAGEKLADYGGDEGQFAANVADKIWRVNDTAVLEFMRGKTRADVGRNVASSLPSYLPLLRYVSPDIWPQSAADWSAMAKIIHLDEDLAYCGITTRGRVLGEVSNDVTNYGWDGVLNAVMPNHLPGGRNMPWALEKMMNQTGASLISRMFIRLSKNMEERWPKLDFHTEIFPLCQVGLSSQRHQSKAVSAMRAANQNLGLPATYYRHVPVRDLFAMAVDYVEAERRPDAEWTQERALRELMVRRAGDTKWPSLPSFPVSWYVDNGVISVENGQMWGWMGESCDNAYDVIMNFIDRIIPDERPPLSTVTDVVGKNSHFIRMISPQDGRAVGYLQLYAVQEDGSPYLEFDPHEYRLFTPDSERYVVTNNRLQHDVANYIQALNAAAIPARPHAEARARIAREFPARNSMETLVDGNPLDIAETNRIRRRLAPVLKPEHQAHDADVPHGLYGFWDQEVEAAIARMVAAHPDLTARKRHKAVQNGTHLAVI